MTGRRTVKVGLVQRACAEDKTENVTRALAGVREAAAGGAELVVLQELFASRYFCQVEDVACFELAEPLGGASEVALQAAAGELGVVIVVPFFEKRAPGLYHNSLVVLGPGGRLGHYRKMHIPDDPQFLEKFYFTPGDLGFQAVATPVAKVGTLICWDQWYPEAARLTALRGAEVLVYPTAIGWLPAEKGAEGSAQLEAWQAVQRGHAVANGCFVVACNRVGFEPSPAGGIEFWGHSFVCDPLGRILAEAGEGEEVLVAELDLGRLDEVRRIWPFFRDRRIDAYGDVVRRYLDD